MNQDPKDICLGEILEQYLKVRPGQSLESMDWDSICQSMVDSLGSKGLTREQMLAALEQLEVE